jgi:hypothetical protein
MKTILSFRKFSEGETASRFWRAQTIGWLFLALMGFFIRWGTFGNVLLAFTLTALLDPVGLLVTSAGAVWHARHPGLPKRKAVAVAVIMALVTASVVAIVSDYIHHLFPPDVLTYVPSNGLSLGFIYYTGIYSIWILVYFGVSAEMDARSARLSKIRAETQALQLTLDYLQQQIEPHFLFDALDTIVAEIPQRPATAQEMTHRLASYLRYSLSQRNSAISSLKEEAEALQTYIDIQALRFGAGRFDYRCEIAQDCLDAGIPHLALQGLAEHAFKHGMEDGYEQPFSIRLRAWRDADALIVEMDNPGRLAVPSDPARNGAALSNLSRRLALHYPGRSGFTLEQRDGRTVARLFMQGVPRPA